MGLGGFAVTRNWLLASVAVGVLVGVLFAAFPFWDLEIAGLFFDPTAAKFPLSIDYSLNIIRRIANWIPFLLLAPAVFVLLRKLALPSFKMLMAPSVVVFLVGSFLLGPGLTSNLLLKENWGRPRPNFVQQFAGSETFQPWWHPSSACKRNCSFVSGEASSGLLDGRTGLAYPAANKALRPRRRRSVRHRGRRHARGVRAGISSPTSSLPG